MCIIATAFCCSPTRTPCNGSARDQTTTFRLRSRLRSPAPPVHPSNIQNSLLARCLPSPQPGDIGSGLCDFSGEPLWREDRNLGVSSSPRKALHREENAMASAGTPECGSSWVSRGANRVPVCRPPALLFNMDSDSQRAGHPTGKHAGVVASAGLVPVGRVSAPPPALERIVPSGLAPEERRLAHESAMRPSANRASTGASPAGSSSKWRARVVQKSASTGASPAGSFPRKSVLTGLNPPFTNLTTH